MADALDLTPPARAYQLDPEARADYLSRSPTSVPPAEASGWSDANTAMEAAFGAAMLGDYLQTRKITRAGREVNPIIGPRGNRVPPELYFPATMGLHYLAMRALPPKWRGPAQALSLGLEGGVVGRNYGLGWNFKL